MKKTPRQSGMLVKLLPPALRQELEVLEAARDDDAVSAQEWHQRADRLIARAATLPAPLRDAFNRSVRGLARDERELERQTGRLVGLPAGADEDAVRRAEQELRRDIESGELPQQEAEELRRRLGGR